MTDKQTFYQNKYDQYHRITFWMTTISALASITYIASDWLIFGEINTTTLLARTAIILPYLIFLLVNRLTNDYRIMVPMLYVIPHCVMWCTIWACCYLPDLSYASDGFIIILATFIFLGFGTPAIWGTIFTGLIFVDILIANTFLHYPDLAMMFMLGVPFYVGICAIYIVIEKSFEMQYSATKTLEESAYHDQLTGVYNRNIFNLIADENGVLNYSDKEELGVILFDIDFFKKVNDTYGHESGDLVLKEVIEIASSQIREGDYLIRWGGEEFVLLLNAPLNDAKVIAERIRKAVAVGAKEVCPITISLGVTKYTGGEYHEAVRVADEALYQAKENGRNRVKVIE